MDREHIKGATDKAKGAIKETAGKMTGDEKLRTEGQLDKAKDAAHKAAGDIKKAERDMREAERHMKEPARHGSAHQGPKNPHE